MDVSKVIDTETKERYIRGMSSQNRMKLKKLEEEEQEKAFKQAEEQAFKMIPVCPQPFEIQTEVVNNATEEYLPLDTYINVLPSIETASSKVKKTPRNINLNSKGKNIWNINSELEVASQVSCVHNLASNSTEREWNNENNMHKKFTLENKPLNLCNTLKDKGQEQKGQKAYQHCNEFANPASNICEMVGDTSKVQVIRSMMKSNLKLIGACVAVVIAMIAVSSEFVFYGVLFHKCYHY